MSCLYDVVDPCALAKSQALACSSGSTSSQANLPASLDELVLKLEMARDVVIEWRRTSSMSASEFDDDFFRDPMGQVLQLFRELIQQSSCIGSCIQHKLPGVIVASYGVVSALSPRYSCKHLRNWGFLDGMMDDMYSLDRLCSVNMELPTAFPGTCGVYTHTSLSIKNGTQVMQMPETNGQYRGTESWDYTNRANRIFVPLWSTLLALI